MLIREMEAGDFDDWSQLWAGYNQFYKRTVEARTTERLWDNLIARTGVPHGFVAEDQGRVLGFTHYFFVPSTSDWTPRCYMQDLFCSVDSRGKGVGRALIEAVYAEADKGNASQTYWLTADDNVDARRLYDKVARLSPFIKYNR